MYLNKLYFVRTSKCLIKRVGRGIGSGIGKTCGRGHKGQRSRAGGKNNRGFEGGQTPFYKRIPKFGFISCIKNRYELPIHLLNKFVVNTNIDLILLRKIFGFSKKIKIVKIINTGVLTTKINIIDKRIQLSVSVRSKIKSLNGNIIN